MHLEFRADPKRREPLDQLKAAGGRNEFLTRPELDDYERSATKHFLTWQPCHEWMSLEE